MKTVVCLTIYQQALGEKNVPSITCNMTLKNINVLLTHVTLCGLIHCTQTSIKILASVFRVPKILN